MVGRPRDIWIRSARGRDWEVSSPQRVLTRLSGDSERIDVSGLDGTFGREEDVIQGPGASVRERERRRDGPDVVSCPICALRLQTKRCPSRCL
jgi:hypothetical protein